MASVIICDLCKAVIEGGPYNDFTKNEDVEWSVSVGLSGDTDRCESCAKKLFAKALRESWDEVKQKRGKEQTLKEFKKRVKDETTAPR